MTDLPRQQVNDLLTVSEMKVGECLSNFDPSIKAGFAELRAGMTNMQNEARKGTADLIKSAVALAIFVVVMTVGLLTFINKTVDEPFVIQPAAPAPIIVAVPMQQPTAALVGTRRPAVKSN